MPGGDGTGPMGMGPMTGRAAGFCAGYGTPGYVSPAFGRGCWGRGGGGGRGWRNMFNATGLTRWQRPVAAFGGAPGYAAPTKDQELGALREQAGYFESALGNIRKRLEELEAEKTA